MNKAVRKLEATKPGKRCDTCELNDQERSKSQAQLRKCVASICPERKPNTKDSAEVENQLNKWFTNKISPYEENYLKKKAEFGRVRDLALNEWLNKPEELNKTELAIFNLSRYLTYWMYQNLVNKDGNSYLANSGIMKTLFPDFTSETESQYQSFVKANQDRLNSLKADLKIIQKANFGLDQNGHKFISGEIKSTLNDLDTDLAKALGKKDLSNLALLRNIDDSTLEVLKFRAKTDSLSSSDIKTISYAKRTNEFLKEVLSKPEAFDNLSKEKFDPKNYALKPNELASFAQKVISDNNASSSETAPVNYCQKMIRDLAKHSPSKQQIEEFKIKFASLKDESLQVFQGKISPEALQKLKQAASTWNPSFSFSREEKMELIERQLDQEKQVLESETAVFDRAANSKSNLPFALGLASKQAGVAIVKQLVNGPSYVQTTCARFAASNIDDSVLDNTIHISSSSLNDVEQRAAIHHEIGHLILNDLGKFSSSEGKLSFVPSPKISDQTTAWMNKVTNCLVENYQNYFKSSPSVQNIKEDFSDLVAFGNDSSKRSFLCQAIETYVAESGDKMSDLSLPDSQEDGKYSNALYRLIMSQQFRSSGLNQICSGALREAGISPKFNNCLKINQ